MIKVIEFCNYCQYILRKSEQLPVTKVRYDKTFVIVEFERASYI